MLCSLKDGSAVLIDKDTGQTRLRSSPYPSENEYEWDGVVVRPFRPCFLSSLLYIPSPVNQSSHIRILDYERLVQDVGTMSYIIIIITITIYIYLLL